jgi:hypothetical protein
MPWVGRWYYLRMAPHFSSQDPVSLAVSSVRNLLSIASDWFNNNLLSLNQSKNQELVCSLSHDLTNASLVKLLGFTIDSHLVWDDHINCLCTKLSRVIYLLRRLRSELPTRFLRILQKKAVRILTDSKPLDHCKPLFRDLGIMTVVNIYIFQVLNSVKLNLNDYVLVNQVHNHNTRRAMNLVTPRCRLHKTLKSFIVVGIKCFNKLPVALRELPYSKFTKNIEKWLLEHPFYNIQEFYEEDLRDIKLI